MANTFYVSDLVERVALLGDYLLLSDDDYMSAGTILTFMDEANARAWEEWSDTDEGWNLTRATASLVVGQSEYDLPVTCHKLRAIEVSQAQGWRRLVRASAYDDAYTGPGAPASYRTLVSTIELLPTPNEAGTLRFTFCPSAPALVAQDQEISGDDGYDQYVVLRTLLMCRLREEKPTGDIERMLGDVMARFVKSISMRDRATPRALIDPLPGGVYSRRRRR